MGKLIYDGQYQVEFDDRVLQHLQIVIASKLRRGESFNFSWTKTVEVGSGRTTIWLSPGISLVYEYHGNKLPLINQAWLERLILTANGTNGLQLVPEPAAAAEES